MLPKMLLATSHFNYGLLKYGENIIQNINWCFPCLTDKRRKKYPYFHNYFIRLYNSDILNNGSFPKILQFEINEWKIHSDFWCCGRKIWKYISMQFCRDIIIEHLFVQRVLLDRIGTQDEKKILCFTNNATPNVVPL